MIPPWLDGFSVGEGLIRQFVAKALGAGYSVEKTTFTQYRFPQATKSSNVGAL